MPLPITMPKLFSYSYFCCLTKIESLKLYNFFIAHIGNDIHKLYAFRLLRYKNRTTFPFECSLHINFSRKLNYVIFIISPYFTLTLDTFQGLLSILLVR